MLNPKFVHDCDECVFIGVIGRYDVYIHDWDFGYRNYVGRYGDEGPEYISGDEERCLMDMVEEAMDERRSVECAG